MPERAYIVNEEKIRNEKDLIYWSGIRKTLEEVGKVIWG